MSSGAFVASDPEKFSKVIQEAKIKPEGWVDMTIRTEQRLGCAEHISAPPLVRQIATCSAAYEYLPRRYEIIALESFGRCVGPRFLRFRG